MTVFILFEVNFHPVVPMLVERIGKATGDQSKKAQN